MTQRRRTATAAAALACLMLVAACSSSKSAKVTNSSASSSSASSSSSRDSSQLAADKEQAAKLVLTLDDFPTGWTAKKRSEEPDPPGQKAAEAELATCLNVDPAIVGDDATDDSKAKAKSDKFKSGQALEADSEATIEANAEQAGTLLQVLRKPEATGCLETFVNKVMQASLDNPNSSTTLPAGVEFGQVQLSDLKLDLHTDSIAYQAEVPFSYSGVQLKVVIDLVFAVRGRTGLTFTYTNLGEPFPSDLEAELANKVIDRTPDS